MEVVKVCQSRAKTPITNIRGAFEGGFFWGGDLPKFANFIMLDWKGLEKRNVCEDKCD